MNENEGTDSYDFGDNTEDTYGQHASPEARIVVEAAPELSCDICGQPALGVAASRVGPMSMAMCRECAVKPAEPVWAFEYLYEEVGEAGEGLAEWVDLLFTWRDGRYISWQEYKEERRGDPPPS